MRKIILTVLLPLLLAACSEESISSEELKGLVSTLLVTDIGNNGNASDIRVIFTASSVNKVNEFRLVLVPTTRLAAFTNETVGGLDPNSYQSVPANSLENEVQLNSSLLDFEGNSISNDVAYTLYILVVGNGAIGIADVRREVLLEDVNVLQGRYRGIWNDNFYSNFAVTTDLTYDNGVLSGPFYYTNTFSACCGGGDDGEIILTLDGDNITSFVYNQRLITYMNGCNGTYNGDGDVQGPTELLIRFEGEDCDGFHMGGRIELSKI